MIELKKISIKNYRSLVNTNVDFGTNLTALIGTNGAGKTNILHSILLLKRLAIDSVRFRRYRSLPAEAAHAVLESTFEINSVKYKLKADLYFDISDEFDSISYSEIKMRNLDRKTSNWVTISPESFSYLDYLRSKSIHPRSSGHLISRSPDINEALYDLSGYLTNFSYYSATQFSDPSKSPISIELEDGKLLRSYTRSGTHGKFIYDLFTTFRSDNKAYKRYLNTVGTLGLKLVDDINFAEHDIPSSSIKVLAGGHIKKISTKRKMVIPSFTVDDLQLSPNQLSEGTFKTLALIFYILNDKNDLLLIEEPEVCVHHGLLGSVIELIKLQSRSKQIIISTHSDYVMDKLEPENIVLVRKTDKGTSAETLDKALSKNDYEALRMYLNETGNLGEYWKESGFSNE